jgi:hypothetical protein
MTTEILGHLVVIGIVDHRFATAKAAASVELSGEPLASLKSEDQKAANTSFSLSIRLRNSG